MAAKADIKYGFYIVIGAIAALYVGSLILARLPK